MSEFDQMEYIGRYQKENVRRVVVKVNRKTQPEVYEYLEHLDNIQGYILNLIKRDIKEKM